MIARAAERGGVRRQAVAQLGDLRGDAFGGQRLADDAGRGDEDVALGHAERRARSLRRSSATAARPAAPVKALELPELTRIAKPPAAARRACAARHSSHQSTGRRARRRAGEDAGDRGSGRDLGQHHVEPAGVAHAGLDGGEAHAGDGRQVGEARRRGQRRDRGPPWPASVLDEVALADRRGRGRRLGPLDRRPRRAAPRAPPRAAPGAAASSISGRTLGERRRRRVARLDRA